jgi:hypothetical protein
MKRFQYLLTISLSFFLTTFIFGCSEPTYPKDKIVPSIKEICKKEYKIDDVEVKIVGNTVGVYLPLEKLFEANFKNLFQSGKVADLESLLRIHPEALDKIENVLNSLTRVIVSASKDVDFFVMKAVDTQVTGFQWTIIGNTNDIKRVNLMDISRSEYRKRRVEDLKINNTILWKKTVEELFSQIGKAGEQTLLNNFFITGITEDNISKLLLADLQEAAFKDHLEYKILKVKSRPNPPNQALVYIQVEETYVPKPGSEQTAFKIPSNSQLEYLFVLTVEKGDFRILRVIPFTYLSENGKLTTIQLPEPYSAFQDVSHWPDEFQLNEIKMDSFLAEQLTFRVNRELVTDERIENTFRELKIRISAPSQSQAPTVFQIDFDFKLR